MDESVALMCEVWVYSKKYSIKDYISVTHVRTSGRLDFKVALTQEEGDESLAGEVTYSPIGRTVRYGVSRYSNASGLGHIFEKIRQRRLGCQG